MKRLAIFASSLLVLTGSALAKECRIPDPKPGRPIRVPQECRDALRPKPQDETLKSEAGAINLGYGTTLRVGGRVRAETGWRR